MPTDIVMKQKRNRVVDVRQNRIFRRFMTTRERLEKQAELIKKQLRELDERIESLSK